MYSIARQNFAILGQYRVLLTLSDLRRHHSNFMSEVNVSQSSSSSSSSSRMRVINHNWPAMKQRLHPQSVAEISRHSVLSGDRIRQCETSSWSRHKDIDQCL